MELFESSWGLLRRPCMLGWLLGLVRGKFRIFLEICAGLLVDLVYIFYGLLVRFPVRLLMAFEGLPEPF